MRLSKRTYKWNAIQYKHITIKLSISDKSSTNQSLHQLKNVQDWQSYLNMRAGVISSTATNTCHNSVSQTINDRNCLAAFTVMQSYRNNRAI